jgi:hypothetical protein
MGESASSLARVARSIVWKLDTAERSVGQCPPSAAQRFLVAAAPLGPTAPIKCVSGARSIARKLDTAQHSAV